MNSSALISVELKQSFKSLSQHVRALVDLAQLHRHISAPPAAATHEENNRISINNNKSISNYTNASNANVNESPQLLDSLSQQLARASGDNEALRLQLQVLSEQSRQKSDKLRALLAAVDELQARGDAAERAAADARQQLEAEREVLSEVRAAFLASTERLDEIDAERSRFMRHAATLRQQNEQLRAHAARLDKHAHYLAEALESRIVSFTTQQHHP